MAEQGTLNPKAEGSSPSGRTTIMRDRVPYLCCHTSFFLKTNAPDRLAGNLRRFSLFPMPSSPSQWGRSCKRRKASLENPRAGVSDLAGRKRSSWARVRAKRPGPRCSQEAPPGDQMICPTPEWPQAWPCRQQRGWRRRSAKPWQGKHERPGILLGEIKCDRYGTSFKEPELV